MRVLMISKACIVGIYQRKLELIARRNVDLQVIVPPSWKDERGEQKLERAYTEGYRLKTLPIYFNGNHHLHFYRGLKAVIGEFKPEIVHIDEEPYNLVTWQALFHAKNAGAKTLFFTWQNIKRHYPPPFGSGEKWVLNNIDFVLAGTESAGKVCRDKGYTGPMRTIPQFGTDINLFQPTEAIPERPFTIGYIGRLVEEKGVHHLLAACAGLGGDWRLRIVGDGPDRKRLQEQAETLGVAERIEFLEWLPSTAMPEQYQQLDVLVLPSLTCPNWKEQFGRVLVEAMASGTPVIGSDSGAIPDVIGNAGLIFPEGDVKALGQCIEQIRQDRQMRNELIAKGRERVKRQFTQESVAEETIKVYEELLADR